MLPTSAGVEPATSWSLVGRNKNMHNLCGSVTEAIFELFIQYKVFMQELVNQHIFIAIKIDKVLIFLLCAVQKSCIILGVSVA